MIKDRHTYLLILFTGGGSPEAFCGRLQPISGEASYAFKDGPALLELLASLSAQADPGAQEDKKYSPRNTLNTRKKEE
jgi:hypothetical protein